MKEAVVIKDFGNMGYAEIYMNGHLYAIIRNPNHEKTMKIAEEIKRDLERLLRFAPNEPSKFV